MRRREGTGIPSEKDAFGNVATVAHTGHIRRILRRTDSEFGVDAATTPTAQPAASPTATPKPAAKRTGPLHTCDPVDSRIAYIHIGDLRVTPVGDGLSYPSTMLSIASAGKPYKLPDPPNSLGGTLANPSLKEGGSGYAFTICNTSKTASHVINGVNVKLEQFAAYSDPANTWQFCDGYYNRTKGAFSGGCGGGFQFDETLHATFAAGDTQAPRLQQPRLVRLHMVTSRYHPCRSRSVLASNLC